MKKRNIFIIVGVACLLIAGGLFFTKSQFDSKVRSDIERFFATLPEPFKATHGRIDVSSADRSVVINDIKGSYTDATGTHEFFIKRAAATGVSVTSFKEKAGVTTLAKTLDLTGTTFTGPLVSGKIDSYKLEEVSGDFAALKDEIVKALPTLKEIAASPDFARSNRRQQQFLGATSGIIKAYETVTIGKSSISGYSYSLKAGKQTVTTSVASMEAGKSSMREFGPFTIKDMKCTLGDAPFFSWESISVDSMKLPSFVAFFEAFAQNRPSSYVFRQALKGQTFVIKNFRSKNLEMRHPLEPGRTLFSLADSTFNYSSEAAHVMQYAFSGLTLEKTIIEESRRLPREVLALLPAVLSFEGTADVTATPRDDNAYDIACKTFSLKGASIGAFGMSTEIDNLNIMNSKTAALKKFACTVTDSGLSDVFFTMEGNRKEKSAAEMREQTVNQLNSRRESLPNDTLKGLVGAVGTFMAAPGKTLSITIAPPSPITERDAKNALLADPAKLGLSYSVTPAK